METILYTIKLKLGITADISEFDDQILTSIALAIGTLDQIGINKPNDEISKDTTWDDYIGQLSESSIAMFVKDYIYLKTKLIFDPPQSSALIEVINKQVSELEWRLNTMENE